MKRSLKFGFAFIALSLFVFTGCEEMEDSPVTIQDELIRIYRASLDQKSIVNDYLVDIGNSAASRNLGLNSLEDLNNLSVLENTSTGENLLFSEISPTQAATFFYDDNGVWLALITKSEIVDEGNLIRYFDEQENLIVEVLHTNDGELEIINVSDNISNGRIAGKSWFDHFDSCLGDFISPFNNSSANLVFGIVSASATLGLYDAMAVALCSSAAWAQYKYED